MGALDGKVAIVTGGTSGIGERIVELFVEEGAKVVVAARREQEGAALEKRLGVRFIRTDVSSEADVKAMVDHAVKCVRPRRLSDQQRRHSVADGQHQRDRCPDHRPAYGGQRPRRSFGHQACGADHDRAEGRQHRQHQQHGGSSRRRFRPHLLRDKGCRAGADALSRRRTRGKGDSRQQHFAGRDRHRHFRQERRRRRGKGRQAEQTCSRSASRRYNRFPARAYRTISRERRSTWRAMGRASSTARTSSSTAVIQCDARLVDDVERPNGNDQASQRGCRRTLSPARFRIDRRQWLRMFGPMSLAGANDAEEGSSLLRSR